MGYKRIFCLCRDSRTLRCPTCGDVAGPGAVHSRRLRTHQVPQTAHQVRPATPASAQSPCHSTPHCGAALLQRNDRGNTHHPAAGRHVLHGEMRHFALETKFSFFCGLQLRFVQKLVIDKEVLSGGNGMSYRSVYPSCQKRYL